MVVAATDPIAIETPLSQYTGVGKLVRSLTEETWCTATLLPSRRQALSAGHCVATMENNETWYIKFVTDPNQPSNPFTAFPFTKTSNPSTTDVFVHPDYQGFGEERMGFDLVVIDLVPSGPCPGCPSLTLLDGLSRYDLFRPADGSDLAVTDIVGYGFSGTGTTGGTFLDGKKRNGKNKLEAHADAMNGLVPNTDPMLPPGSQVLYDFDNGLAVNDAIGEYLGIEDVGFGSQEVNNASADSGGPNFVNGKIAAVHSYNPFRGLITDVDTTKRATFGEMAVGMRIAYGGTAGDPDDGHYDWLDQNWDFVAPKVTEVNFGTTHNNHADYVMPSGHNPAGQPGCTGSGCDVTAVQLRTVPIAKPNEISIRFDQSVLVESSDLQVTGLTTGLLYHTQAGNTFSYDAGTFTAKWTFNPPLAFNNGVSTVDQIELRLSGVTDVNNIPLDAEWINPTSHNATNGFLFPSGNGNPVDGTGMFIFFANFVPADFNRDNLVDGSDFSIWNANKFTGPHGADGFFRGDATGDDFVDGSDFGIWNTFKFTGWRNWPGQQSAMPGGGYGGPSASWLALANQLMRRYHIYENGEINIQLSHQVWELFSDEFAALLAAL